MTTATFWRTYWEEVSAMSARAWAESLGMARRASMPRPEKEEAASCGVGGAYSATKATASKSVDESDPDARYSLAVVEERRAEIRVETRASE